MASRYRPMAVNRPLIIKRGWPGTIEVNKVTGYVGEWVVFELPLSSGATGEIRLPVEDAIEEGLVAAADRVFLSEDDYVDEDEED